MNAQDIVNLAWDMLSDKRETKRNEIADMINYLNVALEDLYRRRPFLLFTDAGAMGTFTRVTAATLATAMTLDEQYLKPLADHVVAQVLMLDSGDETNAAIAGARQQSYRTNT
jgi:hypothetical protein